MSDSLLEDIDYLRDDMRFVLGELSDLQHDLNAVIARIDTLERVIDSYYGAPDDEALFVASAKARTAWLNRPTKE